MCDTSAKKGRGKKKEWAVKVWYPMSKDKNLDVNFKFIHLINNGMEYITPGVDSNVNVVTKKFGELTECIDSGLDICKKLYSELPKCDMQRALLAIKRELTAASSLASSIAYNWHSQFGSAEGSSYSCNTFS